MKTNTITQFMFEIRIQVFSHIHNKKQQKRNKLQTIQSIQKSYYAYTNQNKTQNRTLSETTTQTKTYKQVIVSKMHTSFNC